MWAVAGYGTHAQSRCAHRDTGEGRWQPLRDGSESRLTKRGECHPPAGAERRQGHVSSQGSRPACSHGPACPHRSRLCREPLRQKEVRLEQPREDAPSPGNRASRLSAGGLTGWAWWPQWTHSVHGPPNSRDCLGALSEGLGRVGRLGQVLWPQEEQGQEPAIARMSCVIQEEPTLLTKWQRAAGGARRAPRARCRGEESGEGRLSPAEGAP